MAGQNYAVTELVGKRLIASKYAIAIGSSRPREQAIRPPAESAIIPPAAPLFNPPLSGVNGIGPARLAALAEIGIVDAGQLAAANADQIANLMRGVSREMAAVLIATAKVLVEG